MIEITETAIMRDAEMTARQLRVVKTLGVGIAIDDFGTGYSSLAYLRQFPVDILKIDRSFITPITDSVESRALLHTLVQLGKQLGLKTLAEGIEQHEQFCQLQDEQCDSGQGFMFARPLGAGDVEDFLATLPHPQPAPPGHSGRVGDSMNEVAMSSPSAQDAGRDPDLERVTEAKRAGCSVLESGFRALLQSQPRACVSAINDHGIFVELPAALRDEQHEVLRGRSALDLVAPDRARVVIDAWDRVPESAPCTRSCTSCTAARPPSTSSTSARSTVC